VTVTEWTAEWITVREGTGATAATLTDAAETTTTHHVLRRLVATEEDPTISAVGETVATTDTMAEAGVADQDPLPAAATDTIAGVHPAGLPRKASMLRYPSVNQAKFRMFKSSSWMNLTGMSAALLLHVRHDHEQDVLTVHHLQELCCLRGKGLSRSRPSD
jgi:hypothetical protein